MAINEFRHVDVGIDEEGNLVYSKDGGRNIHRVNASSSIAQYGSGGPVTIANGDGANLPFASLDGGVELLDRTDPLDPKILVSGVYALIAGALCESALTAGGMASVSATLAGAEITNNSAAWTTKGGFAWHAVVIGPLDAGDSIAVAVVNFDGVSSRDFDLYQTQLIKLA